MPNVRATELLKPIRFQTTVLFGPKASFVLCMFPDDYYPYLWEECVYYMSSSRVLLFYHHAPGYFKPVCFHNSKSLFFHSFKSFLFLYQISSIMCWNEERIQSAVLFWDVCVLYIKFRIRFNSPNVCIYWLIWICIQPALKLSFSRMNYSIKKKTIIGIWRSLAAAAASEVCPNDLQEVVFDLTTEITRWLEQ